MRTVRQAILLMLPQGYTVDLLPLHEDESSWWVQSQHPRLDNSRHLDGTPLSCRILTVNRHSVSLYDAYMREYNADAKAAAQTERECVWALRAMR